MSVTTSSLAGDLGIPEIPSGDPTVGADTPPVVTPAPKRNSSNRARRQAKPKVQPPPLPKAELPKKEPDDSQIEKITAEILSFTAVVHATPMLPNLQCDYCRDHILDQAPATAKDLVKLSHDYPFLRGALVGVTRFFGGVGAIGCVADLYGSSFGHHGPEIPVVTPMLTVAYGQPTKVHPEGMPPRKRKEVHKGDQHAHSSATAGTAHHAAHTESTETETLTD